MVPMPSDSLKKARPSAVSATAGVILEKSGWNRKASPLPAPSSVRLRTHSTSNRMNSSGTSRRVTASIPFDTPNMMMPPVSASTTHCQASTVSGEETSAPNAAPATFGSIVEISPDNGLENVGVDPAGDLGIERHDQQRGGEAHPADRLPPPLPARRENFEAGHRVGPRRPAEHRLGDHHWQADQQGGGEIDQQEACAAVGSGERGEFPDVAQPDRRAEGRHQHAKRGGERVAMGFGHVSSGRQKGSLLGAPISRPRPGI